MTGMPPTEVSGASFGWVVFRGHGYYADSVWTDYDGALDRATGIARSENELIDPDWRDDIVGRYLREWRFNTPNQDDS